MASPIIQEQYEQFNKLEKVIHGTKICEGNLYETLLFEVIRDTGIYDEVVHGMEIPLVKNETSIKGDRKCHKVDIFCKSNEPPKITAYNSKGKSFNNTESNESALSEYKKYKMSIEIAYPGYEVEYCILKDGYNNDPKLVKYHYLATNGIPVYNSQICLNEKYGILNVNDVIETKRQIKVLEIIKQRFKSSGLSIDNIKEMLS